MIQHHNEKTRQTKATQNQTAKPVLLFVDYEVPQYDLFAGSRTNFMYLEMLVEMGLDIKFLAQDFCRVEPYSSELNQLGIETLDGDWYRQNWKTWLKENGQAIDYVFIHKPDPAGTFLPAVLRYTNASILYQCHDLHYLRLQRKAEVENNKAILDEAARYEKKEDFIFSNSDVLLTFSEVEENIIREKFPHKKVFTIPLFFYRDTREPGHDFSRRQDLLYIGACAHTPNRDAVSWFCRQIFPLIQQRIPGISINVVGADPPADIIAMESKNIRILDQVSEEKLKALYETTRMMVVPLRFGAGVKGKVIEALHNGIPLVSTTIGLEGIKGVEQLASAQDNPGDFADEVVALYTDEGKLRELSRRGLKFVADNFTVQGTAALMKGILSISRDEAVLRMAESVPVDIAPGGQNLPVNEPVANRQHTGDSVDASVDQLISELDEQRYQLDKLQVRLAQREQQIEDILISTSWKATLPLRWVKRHLLDLKRKIKN